MFVSGRLWRWRIVCYSSLFCQEFEKGFVFKGLAPAFADGDNQWGALGNEGFVVGNGFSCFQQGLNLGRFSYLLQF